MYGNSNFIDMIAAADCRAPFDLLQQIRNVNLRPLLEPIDEPNRVYHRYDFREVVRAQLLLAAVDAGVRYTDLGFVNDTLNRILGPGEWNDPTISTMPGLDAIISAANTDILASLEIRTGYVDGVKIQRAAVILENWSAYPDRAWDTLDNLRGASVTAHVTIPASRLAAKLIEARG